MKEFALLEERTQFLTDSHYTTRKDALDRLFKEP